MRHVATLRIQNALNRHDCYLSRGLSDFIEIWHDAALQAS